MYRSRCLTATVQVDANYEWGLKKNEVGIAGNLARLHIGPPHGFIEVEY